VIRLTYRRVVADLRLRSAIPRVDTFVVRVMSGTPALGQPERLPVMLAQAMSGNACMSLPVPGAFGIVENALPPPSSS
jgi:hypothetical protein